jgi:metal transporter CNNM
MRRYLEEHQFASFAEEEAFYTKNIIGAIISVLLVGLIAGLFLGLMTLDALDLQIIGRASVDEDERKYAAKLLPIVSQRHRLLVTLLILNALAYETLPIFLDALVPSWAA